MIVGKILWTKNCFHNLSMHINALTIPFLSIILALCSDVDVYYSSHHLTELGFLSLCTFPLKSSALVHIKSLWVKGVRESSFTILALYTQSFPNMRYMYINTMHTHLHFVDWCIDCILKTLSPLLSLQHQLCIPRK